MATAGATTSSPDTDPNPADPDAAVREALLSQLTRYVDVHIVQELARHAGHADIVLELSGVPAAGG